MYVIDKNYYLHIAFERERERDMHILTIIIYVAVCIFTSEQF